MPRFAFITPALTAVLLAASATAMAQAPAPSGDARARYEQEREKCMTNNTQDSLATCLREANNALDASRKGQLSNPGPAASENTTQRCEAFQTAAEQAECVRRTQSSSVSGSVSGGGVLRESVTTTVIPAK
ncbi:hypothetical protein ASF11_14485 [Acidovorax sp. Leaf76]|jgi:hypothetical protein|uniref:hypothetical protein n=1 Tax=unclassified Acidovorax TaxID=2684926 RepID=UPI0006F50BED|nr:MULTISPECIES: hypothetical protein [unclassified Acidovorax]KQO14024.1 hypothetical protein ASF11_14485 [Acidovorax sp. Leaf76]KQO31544.1 hypothetical protein ASF19_12180 [Acidovorax sp. Leaf84]KQS27563.1 hypothetical protein ASG27_16315 [Acidovorax sp. Leaf191]